MDQIIATFGVNWKLLFIQAVNFGVLLLALWYFLYRPVIRIIAKRQEKITEGVKNAEAAAALRKETEGKSAQVLAAAGKEAENILEAGKRHAEKAERTLLAEAKRKEERILAQAKEKAEEDGRRMREELKEEVARMAILAAEKILRKQISQ